jgi:hypothetical protein
MTNFFCVACRTAKGYICIFEGNTMCNICLDIAENERKKQQKRSNPKPKLLLIINIAYKKRSKATNNNYARTGRQVSTFSSFMCINS